jgi:hypothetical protein
MAINFKNKQEVYTGAVDTANRYTDKRYGRTQTIIYAVLIVIILAFVQIIIDSFRFSAVTYKEYENRMEERSVYINENRILLENIKLNQENILKKLK